MNLFLSSIRLLLASALLATSYPLPERAPQTSLSSSEFTHEALSARMRFSRLVLALTPKKREAWLNNTLPPRTDKKGSLADMTFRIKKMIAPIAVAVLKLYGGSNLHRHQTGSGTPVWVAQLYAIAPPAARDNFIAFFKPFFPADYPIDPTNPKDIAHAMIMQKGSHGLGKDFERTFLVGKFLLADDKEPHRPLNEAWFYHMTMDSYRQGNTTVGFRCTFDLDQTEDDFRATVDAATRGIARAERETQGAIKAHIILALRKKYPAKTSNERLDFWLRYIHDHPDQKDRLIGIDSIMEEKKSNYKVSDQEPLFAKARAAGQMIFFHIGEEWYSRNLHDALTRTRQVIVNIEPEVLTNSLLFFVNFDTLPPNPYFGTRRRALTNVKDVLLQDIKLRGIVLEMSPTSNTFLTAKIREEEGWRFLPLRTLLDMGIRVVITDDDSGSFGTSYGEELRRLYLGQTAYGPVRLWDLLRLVRNSRWAVRHHIRERRLATGHLAGELSIPSGDQATLRDLAQYYARRLLLHTKTERAPGPVRRAVTWGRNLAGREATPELEALKRSGQTWTTALATDPPVSAEEAEKNMHRLLGAIDVLSRRTRSADRAFGFDDYIREQPLLVGSIGKGKNKDLVKERSLRFSDMSRRMPTFEVSVNIEDLVPPDKVMNAHLLKGQVRRLLDRAIPAGGAVMIDATDYAHRDLLLTVFKDIANEKSYRRNGAALLGITFQTYYNDSLQTLETLLTWARPRRVAGWAPPRIRLVKGGQWEEEVKRALADGKQIPVIYDKDPKVSQALSDISYDNAVTMLLKDRGLFYPAFATHRVETIGWIMALVQKYKWYIGEVELQMHFDVANRWKAALAKRNVIVRNYVPVHFSGQRMSERRRGLSYITKPDSPVQRALTSGPDDVDQHIALPEEVLSALRARRAA